MIELSIIIPVYNEEAYLKRCLDSVRTSFNSVEVIIIEDASSDRSPEICDEYKDVFTVIHHSTNWGVSMSRNHGMSLAHGKYITFLDSDDEMSKEGISNMLQYTSKDIPVIQFDHNRYYYRTQRTVTKYRNKSGYYGYSCLPQIWCTVWNKIYLRSFINENHIIFDEQICFGEDEIFNLRCIKNYPKIFCSQLIGIIKHFENQESICHTLNKEKLIGQTDALLRLLKEENEPEFDALVRNVITEHWNSETYKKYVGGDLL